MADLQVRICSDGTFHISGIKGDKVIDGGGKKSKKRYYIYNKHRYTKTVMQNKKKCIFCKTEQKYIPVKSLKGGTIESTSQECTELHPLPPDVLAFINKAANNNLPLKDVFPFYLAVAKSIREVPTLRSFLINYLNKTIGDSDIVIELVAINNNTTITFNKENINNSVDALIYYKDLPYLYDFRYYGPHREGQKVASFIGFLNFEKLADKGKRYITNVNREVDLVVKELKELNKTRVKSLHTNKIPVRKLYLLLKELSALKKTLLKKQKNTRKGPNNSIHNSLNTIGETVENISQETGFIEQIIGKLNNEIDILKNTKDKDIKLDTLDSITAIINHPEDVDFEPDLDDNYLMYYGADY